MHVLFSPALGEVVRVNAPLHWQSSYVQLRFTARFQSHKDYEEAKRDRVRVELWTNIPLVQRGGKGWGELAFKELNSTITNDGALSLLSPESSSYFQGLQLEQKSGTSTPILCLQSLCRMPVGESFWYTFRLVYPSGKINWLGTPKNNGIVQCHPSQESRFQLRVQLPSSYSLEGNLPLHGDIGIFRLSADMDWFAWTAENCQNFMLSPPGSTLNHKSMGIFIPRPKPTLNHRVLSLPLVLKVSNCQFSVTPDGVVTLNCSQNGRYHAILRDLNPDMESTADFLTTQLPLGHQLMSGGDPNFVFIVSKEDHDNATISVIPVYSPSSPVWDVRISRRCLAAVLPETSRFFVLTRDPTTDCRLVDSSNDRHLDEVVSLRTGAFGGQFVVAPAYSLSAGDNSWDISFLSSHGPVHDTHTALPEKHVNSETETGQISSTQILTRSRPPVNIVRFIPVYTLLLQSLIIRTLTAFFSLVIRNVDLERESQSQQIPSTSNGQHEIESVSSSPPGYSALPGELNGDEKGVNWLSPSLFVEVRSTNTQILVRARTPGASARELRMKIEDKAVSPTIKRLKDASFLLTFSTAGVSNLTISLE